MKERNVVTEEKKLPDWKCFSPFSIDKKKNCMQRNFIILKWFSFLMFSFASVDLFQWYSIPNCRFHWNTKSRMWYKCKCTTIYKMTTILNISKKSRDSTFELLIDLRSFEWKARECIFCLQSYLYFIFIIMYFLFFGMCIKMTTALILVLTIDWSKFRTT